MQTQNLQNHFAFENLPKNDQGAYLTRLNIFGEIKEAIDFT